MSTNTPHTSTHRSSDLLWGVLFIVLGGFRFYQILSGTQMSKWRIFMSVAIVVWGVFKVYSYFKTKNIEAVE